MNLSVEANIGMEPTFAFEIKEKRDDYFNHKYISSWSQKNSHTTASSIGSTQYTIFYANRTKKNILWCPHIKGNITFDMGEFISQQESREPSRFSILAQLTLEDSLAAMVLAKGERWCECWQYLWHNAEILIRGLVVGRGVLIATKRGVNASRRPPNALIADCWRIVVNKSSSLSSLFGSLVVLYNINNLQTYLAYLLVLADPSHVEKDWTSDHFTSLKIVCLYLSSKNLTRHDKWVSPHHHPELAVVDLPVPVLVHRADHLVDLLVRHLSWETMETI